MSRKALDNLVDATLRTRDDELTCDEWIQRVGAYVDVLIAGGEVPAAMELVAHHATLCPHCADELEALLDAVTAVAD